MGKHHETLLDKLAYKVDFGEDEDSCWLWKCGINSQGYGQVWLNGRTQYPHRATYEHFIGPIPEGLDVGHKCHDKAAAEGLCDGTIENCFHKRCCNPAHLKAETRSENVQSSVLWRRAITRKKGPKKRPPKSEMSTSEWLASLDKS
jgi:hypothetical protein